MLRNFRQVRRHRRLLPKHQVAEVQILESRSLPTGTVTVAFASNVLTLTGDGKGNELDVQVVTTDNVVKINVTGIEGTRIKVGAVISESEEPVIFTPTAAFGIVANLAGGSDLLTVNVEGGLGTRSLTKLDVNTGDEDDHVDVTIGAGTTLNFTDVISIKTGEGHDHVMAGLNGVVTTTKSLTIDTGLDSDFIEINVGEQGALTVTGAVAFNTSDGHDTLDFLAEGAVTFNGTLGINTGEDDDELNLNFAQGLSVKGLATITTLDGDDEVNFLNVGSTLNFQAGLTVNLGSGDDKLLFNHEFVEADGEEVVFDEFFSLEGGTLSAAGTGLTVIAGSGNDTVLISEKLNLTGGANITTGDGIDEISILTGLGTAAEGPIANTIGKLTVDTGDDADRVHLEAIPGTTLSVTAVATLSTGKGNDLVVLLNDETTVSFAGGLSIDTGATPVTSSGFDVVALGGGRLNVTGALKIATGGASDSVTIIESLFVTGDVNILTGTANDDVFVRLEPSLTPPAEGVAANSLGSVTINSGTGSDFVELYTAEGGSTRIGGTVSITTETGLDDVWLDTDANLTIVKDLILNTGAGDDHVFVEAIQGSIRVNGSQTVTLGDDDECFVQGQSAALDDFRDEESEFVGEGNPDATIQIDLNLTINGNSGDDFIGLDLIQIGKDKPTPASALPASVTTINSGVGDDVIAVDDVILRDLKILADAGNDIVTANDVTVRGTTNIDLGAGGDEFAVFGATSLGDNVTLLGGAGDDDFSIGIDVTLAAGKKVKLDGGADDDIVANESTDIDEADLNPLPPLGIENLEGVFDIIEFQEIVHNLFSSCLLNFEFSDFGFGES